MAKPNERANASRSVTVSISAGTDTADDAILNAIRAALGALADMRPRSMTEPWRRAHHQRAHPDGVSITAVESHSVPSCDRGTALDVVASFVRVAAREGWLTAGERDGVLSALPNGPARDQHEVDAFLEGDLNDIIAEIERAEVAVGAEAPNTIAATWNRAALVNARRKWLHYESLADRTVAGSRVAAELEPVVVEFERAADEIDRLYAALAAREPRDLTDAAFDAARERAAAELSDFEPGERMSLFDGVESDDAGIHVNEPARVSRALAPHAAQLTSAGIGRVRIFRVPAGTASAADWMLAVDPVPGVSVRGLVPAAWYLLLKDVLDIMQPPLRIDVSPAASLRSADAAALEAGGVIVFHDEAIKVAKL